MANIDNGVILGALGSVFVDTDASIVPPVGMVIVAIQMLSDNNIHTLIAQEPTRFFNTAESANGVSAGNETVDVGSGGQTVASGGHRFPAGMTIYGRWVSAKFEADSVGGVICYFGY